MDLPVHCGTFTLLADQEVFCHVFFIIIHHRFLYCSNSQINKEQLSDQTQQLNHSHEKSHYNKHMEGEQGHVKNLTRPKHTYTHTMSNLLHTSPLKLRHE